MGEINITKGALPAALAIGTYDTIRAIGDKDGHRAVESSSGTAMAVINARFAADQISKRYPADPRFAKFKPAVVAMGSFVWGLAGANAGKAADLFWGDDAQKALDNGDKTLHKVDKTVAAVISPVTDAVAKAVESIRKRGIKPPVEAEAKLQAISAKPPESTKQTGKS